MGQDIINDDLKTAILVDGGFYRKRAFSCIGDIPPEERADELVSYCMRHLNEKIDGKQHHHMLYRIFYYDCEPVTNIIFHPLKRMNISLRKSPTFDWTNQFLNELKRRRKLAIRLGKLSVQQAHYGLTHKAFKKLCNGTITFDELEDSDIVLNIDQKGVDMKIGIDIASLAYKKQVDQIVLIAGDSDFVPAAKLARREGIDFILDPLGANIKPDLFEHVDGLRSCDNCYKTKI